MPDWLRNKKGMLLLDVYADELCIFRCLAVHRGVHCQYNTRQTREWKPMHNQQKLVGALSAQKVMLCAPLLKWYIGHNLKITVVHRPIDYVPQKIFTWFVNKISENRHKGHQNPELAVSAEVFKLFGNSAYGKLSKPWKGR